MSARKPIMILPSVFVIAAANRYALVKHFANYVVSDELSVFHTNKVT